MTLEELDRKLSRDIRRDRIYGRKVCFHLTEGVKGQSRYTTNSGSLNRITAGVRQIVKSTEYLLRGTARLGCRDLLDGYQQETLTDPSCSPRRRRIAIFEVLA